MGVRMSKFSLDSNRPRVAVVGSGIFGSAIALKLAEEGADVTLFDRASDLLMGASFNNQNRLHLGFHYPRDDETAMQCIKGFQRFKNEFGECVKEGFENAYFIANENSKVTPNEYLSFCNRIGLKYEVLDLNLFTPFVDNVGLGIKTEEVVYDCGILRELVRGRFAASNVVTKFDVDITKIARVQHGYSIGSNSDNYGSFDAVINSTYANINRLNSQLGLETPERQYEYTMIPIVEWDRPPVGITIMDGAFMTVLPFGKTGKFLLYHVDHTVVETKVSSHLPLEWLDKKSSPSTLIDHDILFNNLKKSCLKFIPDLVNIKHLGFLEGPRMVLAKKDNTDARPSIINRHENGYFSVFTGKIDHCMWVADEIANAIFE